MSFTYEIPRKYRPERLRNKKFLAYLKIFHRGSVYLFSPVVKNIKPQCLSVSLLCTGGREGGVSPHSRWKTAPDFPSMEGRQPSPPQTASPGGECPVPSVIRPSSPRSTEESGDTP